MQIYSASSNCIHLHEASCMSQLCNQVDIHQKKSHAPDCNSLIKNVYCPHKTPHCNYSWTKFIELYCWFFTHSIKSSKMEKGSMPEFPYRAVSATSPPAQKALPDPYITRKINIIHVKLIDSQIFWNFQKDTFIIIKETWLSDSHCSYSFFKDFI